MSGNDASRNSDLRGRGQNKIFGCLKSQIALNGRETKGDFSGTADHNYNMLVRRGKAFALPNNVTTNLTKPAMSRTHAIVKPMDGLPLLNGEVRTLLTRGVFL